VAITRIEVAIECDEPFEEGVMALAVMTASVGLDVERDVAVTLTSGEDGKPVLLAVLMHDDDESDEGNHDDDSGL
jgi:hypothetical protein